MTTTTTTHTQKKKGSYKQKSDTARENNDHNNNESRKVSALVTTTTHPRTHTHTPEDENYNGCFVFVSAVPLGSENTSETFTVAVGFPPNSDGPAQARSTGRSNNPFRQPRTATVKYIQKKNFTYRLISLNASATHPKIVLSILSTVGTNTATRAF